MTVKKTLTAIRALGANVRYSDGEYRVNIPRGTESTAYYTDDAVDAYGTAKLMMHRHNQIKSGKAFGLFGA
jgi:hypothetical protein